MIYDVVIVGAGAAGAGAARVLAERPLSVLIVEAGQRVGGRGYTATVEGMPLDLGCGWLHSAERNPFTGLASAAGFTVDQSPSAWLTQYRDLGFSPQEREAARSDWHAVSDRLETVGDSDRAFDAVPPDAPWLNFMQLLSGVSNGAPLDELSAADLLAYDAAASGNNWRVREGYGRLISYTLPSLPIRFGTPVTAIETAGDGVRLSTDVGTITARSAIVTASTNVLASGTIALEGGLDEHCHAASLLPLGLANKCFLAIDGPSPFEPETHVIGNPRKVESGTYYISAFGRPAIEAYFGGTAARALEREGLAAGFTFAVDELAALFGSDVRRCLRPLAATTWGQQTYFGGSYSHALVGTSGMRGTLATPYRDRLFFAGEATHPSDFSTAHGAYESGQRAAAQVLSALAATAAA